MKMFEEIVKFLKEPRNLILLLFGPIIFTFLIGGCYYNDYIKDIPIVILDQDNTPISRSIVKEFSNSERYYIKDEVNSFDELKNIIDEKKSYIGIYIPKDFNKDIKKLRSSSVMILIDETNVTLGNTALGSATEILSTLNAGIDVKVLEAKGVDPTTALKMAKVFKTESRVLYDPKMTYKAYSMPGMAIVFVQQMFLSLFVAKIIEDRKRKFLKALIFASVGTISYTLCNLILKYFLDIQIRGSLLVVAIYMFVFLMSLVGPCMIIGSIFKDRLKVTQFCMLLSMPTFLTVGYVWPLSQIPKPLVILVKSVWPLIYAMAPMRDILIKNTPVDIFTNNILSLIGFGIVWFIIGYIVFKYTFDKIDRRKTNEQEGIA